MNKLIKSVFLTLFSAALCFGTIPTITSLSPVSGNGSTQTFTTVINSGTWTGTGGGGGGGTSGNATSIQGTAVSATSPTTGQALVDTTSGYVPMTLTPLSTTGLGTKATGTSTTQINVSMGWRCVGTPTVCTNNTTSDTLANSDCGGLVTYDNSTATTVTVPKAGVGGFAQGCPITLTNYGSAPVNLNVTGSTFALGVASAGTTHTYTINPLGLATAPASNSSFHSCLLVSDGTNWQVGACN